MPKQSDPGHTQLIHIRYTRHISIRELALISQTVCDPMVYILLKISHVPRTLAELSSYLQNDAHIGHLLLNFIAKHFHKMSNQSWALELFLK